MELLAGIESRTSALKLEAPGPTPEHLEQILHAGTRAPDHGRLKPWRFVVMEDAKREVLADAMVELLLEKSPDATADQQAKERGKPLRAPTIVAVAAHIIPGKIPEIEQVAAVAAAVQNMFLAAHSLGYGAMWKTGAAAYSEKVNRALGFEGTDKIIALLYLGTLKTAAPVIASNTADVTRRL